MDRRNFLKRFGARALNPAFPSIASPALPTCVPDEASPCYRGISVVSVSRSRRISLPKHFKFGSPYGLIGLSASNDPQPLFVVEPSVMQRLIASIDCRIFSEHRTSRPTLPAAICEEFSIVPTSEAVLVGMGNYLELWAKESWMDMIAKLL